MSTLITVESLKNFGYKEYFGGACHFRNADALYQKCININNKKRYFINIYYYTFPDHESFMAEACLYWSKDGPWLTAQLNGISILENVELLFAQLYQSMGCVPDVHNND
jgi:hypothetical protein